MGNAILKISNLFCGLAMDGPSKGSYWGIVGSWWLDLFSWIFNLINTFFYMISRFVLNIVDFFQFLIQKLVGLDVWGDSGVPSMEELSKSDLIFKFIYHDAVQKVFKYLSGVCGVLLIIFTIVAIIKQEYAVATAPDITKASNDKMEIFKRSLKALFLVIVIPILLVMGILSSNAILASIINAINGGNNLTFGGQIFVASAYDANSYRVYANNGVRMPVTNSINGYYSGGEVKDENWVVFKDSVSTALTPVVPKKYGVSVSGNEKSEGGAFTGYMFSVSMNYGGKSETKTYLYYVEPEEDGAGDKNGDVYKYITSVLGGKIEVPSDVSCERWGYDDPYDYQDNVKLGIKVDLHAQNAESSVNQAAYNTWYYNDLLFRNYEFEETVGYTTSTFTGVTEFTNPFTGEEESIDDRTVKSYYNKGDWALLHDGGANGLVALKDEYLAVADVIDYMIGYNYELSIINLYETEDELLDYSYLLASDYKKSNKNFVVNYKQTGEVLYTPENAIAEEDGAIYVFAFKQPETIVKSTGEITSWKYRPLTNAKQFVKVVEKQNNGEYEIVEKEINALKSPVFDSNYHGIVVARGIFEATFKDLTGRPTQIYQEKEGSKTINFKRDVVKDGAWFFDLSFNILSKFGGGATWRFKLSIGDGYSESVEVKEKFAVENGDFAIDYNFAGKNMRLSTFFIPSKINPIILVFATVLVFIVLGQSVWGLIGRIYDIALYFLILPGVVSTMPLDSNAGMFNKWKGELVKKVFSAYGVLIGLNIFFVLLEPMREAAQLFTDSDLTNSLSKGNFLNGVGANYVNNLVYLLFMLVALTLIKTLPGTISGMLGFGDAYSDGASVKGNVESTVKEVGSHVSGQKAKENFETYVGSVGEDGTWQHGQLMNFVPGSAIWDARNKAKKKKNQEEQDRATQEAENEARQNAEALVNEADNYGVESEVITEVIPEEIGGEEIAEIIEDAIPEKEPVARTVVEDSHVDEDKKPDEPAKADVPATEVKGSTEPREEPVEEPEEEKAPEIDDVKLAALKAAIIATLTESLTELKDKAKENPEDADLQAEIKAIESAISSVKAGDLSGIDNATIEQYGKNQRLLNTSNKFADASSYGDLSEVAKANLGEISGYEASLKSKREATDELLKKLAPGKTLDEKGKFELLKANGISYDKKSQVAYSDDASIRLEHGIGSGEELEFIKNALKESKGDLKASVQESQDKLVSGIADQLVEKQKANAVEGTGHADTAVTAEHADTAKTAGSVDPQASGILAQARAFAEQSKVNAEKARLYAEANKLYADIAGKRIKPTKVKHDNITQRKLDKLIAKRDKRDERQAKGKAQTTIINNKNREKAYNQFNNEKKEIKDIIFNGDNNAKKTKAVMDEAIKRHNSKNSKKGEADPDNIIDKSDRENYIKAAENYYKSKNDGKAPIDRKKMLENFDRHQEDLKRKAVDEHFDAIKKDAMIQVWNENQKDGSTTIKDWDSIKDDKTAIKKVEKMFAQDQETKKMSARNNFINDRLDRRIDRQQARVDRRGDSGFIGYMAKTIALGATGGLTRKTTDKDRAKLNNKLEQQEETAKDKKAIISDLTKNIGNSRAKIKELDEQIKEARDKKDDEGLKKLIQERARHQNLINNSTIQRQKERAELNKLEREIAHTRESLASDRQGFVHSFARNLRDGKRAKRVKNENLAFSRLIRKEANARKKAFKEMTFDMGHNVTVSGRFNKKQADSLTIKHKTIESKKEAISKLKKQQESATNDFTRTVYKQELEKEQRLLEKAEKDFNRTFNRYSRHNRENYVNRNNNRLARIQEKRLKNQRTRAMLEMDEAIRLGRDTTGHQARIEHINAQIEKVKSSYVRHKPFKNAKNKGVIFAKGMVEKVPKIVEPGVKFVKKVTGKVVDAVTDIKPVGYVSRRQKAKKALMEVDPETRREIRQETQDAINKKAKQITQSVAQSEYINKITQALLKENRGDLAKKITNSESARAALEEALRQSRSKRSEADGIIKTTKDARARTEAIERKKEIDKEIRRLQAAQRLVAPESVEPANVSEDEAGRARRQAHKTAQNKATAKYKGKRKSTSSTGSAYESKEERKSESDKKEDKSATVDEKKVKELVEKELSKRVDSATENAIKKGVKVGDVNASNAAIKKLALRVKKAEGETAKLKRQLRARRIPKGMEVPKIELNNTPPDTPTGNA